MVRVERQVRSVQERQANSCSQALLCLVLEAFQLVSSPHLLHFGGDGVLGGWASLGSKYMVFNGRTWAVGAGAGAEVAGVGTRVAGVGAAEVAGAGARVAGVGANSWTLCALPTCIFRPVSVLETNWQY